MAIIIRDIAKKVGVSINTVSRAINNKPDVSEKTRNLILKTAEELNYIPNYIAKSLVIKKTNTLGVSFPDIKESYYSEILDCIEKIARKYKYNILLANADNSPDKECEAIRMLLEKRVDGLLIMPTLRGGRYIDLIKEIDIPYVLLNIKNDFLECSYVVYDKSYGLFLATNYLIKKGYEEIYYICAFYDSPRVQESIESCKKAFKKNKISLDRLKLLPCERNLNAYYEITKNNINFNRKKTGILAWDDEMALGVYKAVIDKGLKIPENVGIIGHDDIESSKYFPKPLTTIHAPSSDMGIKGTKLLIKIIKSKELEKPEKIVIKPKLIIRETT